MTESSFIRLACSRDVVTRAIKVGFIVGSLLAAINHADAVAALLGAHARREERDGAWIFILR